jgi:hypothetical protein
MRSLARAEDHSPLAEESSLRLAWTEQFKIHSFEVDCSGVGTVESVCRHFQEAAWNHAEHLGVGYERLRKENRIWVLSRMVLKFERSLRWGETITVQPGRGRPNQLLHFAISKCLTQIKRGLYPAPADGWSWTLRLENLSEWIN